MIQTSARRVWPSPLAVPPQDTEETLEVGWFGHPSPTYHLISVVQLLILIILGSRPSSPGCWRGTPCRCSRRRSAKGCRRRAWTRCCRRSGGTTWTRSTGRSCQSCSLDEELKVKEIRDTLSLTPGSGLYSPPSFYLVRFTPKKESRRNLVK